MSMVNFSGDYKTSFTCPKCEIHGKANDVSMIMDSNNIWFRLVQCSNDDCKSKTSLVYQSDSDASSAFHRLTLIHKFPNSDETVDSSIPPEISESYIQGIRALNAGSPLGAVTCFRRALQQICKNKNTTKSGLKAQLEEVIPAPYKELVTEIREWGNIGAHPDADIPNVSQEDVVEIRDFTKNVFDILYITPAKVNARKQKRETTQNP